LRVEWDRERARESERERECSSGWQFNARLRCQLL